MTHREYMRLRRWEARTRDAHRAGYVEGYDARLLGYSLAPLDGHAVYDTRFVVFRRWEQSAYNHAVARSRGRAEGWDAADERLFGVEVASGLDDLQRWLGEAA